MPRIYLQVAFRETDAVKNLGARWDGALRKWYVPDGVECKAFDQWVTKPPPPPNIRAPFWYLALSNRACWRCTATSRVFAIMLPPAYESLIIADDPADDRWMGSEESTLLSYISDVSETVASELCRRAPLYRLDYSQTTRSSYWMNHCEHCQAKLGDFETVQETGTFHFYEFETTTPESSVKLMQIDEPFAASCGSYTL